MLDDPEVLKKVEKIVEIHASIKGMILYTEEITNMANPQQLLETRDVLDHILRVIIADVEKKYDLRYKVTNLSKAVGHMCRGGYDVLDWTSLVLKQKIEEELKGFSVDAISKVIKNYYTEIKPTVLKISTEIAKIRGTKDVGNITLEDFDKYFQAVLKLQEYYKSILEKKASLVEVEKDLKKKNRRDWIIPTVTTIFGVVAGAIITYTFF